MILDLLFGGSDNLLLNLLLLLIMLPALLFSLSAHEFAHGFAAYKQGDHYAKMMGRLSLNPFKHLDPIGTLLLLFCGFGWAKPVPIVPQNFKNGKKSMLIVASAGIITNLIIAVIAVFFSDFLTYVVKLSERDGFIGYVLLILYLAFHYLAIININLALFNLLPIPPLDGYKIFRELLSGKVSYTFFANIERYSNFIMIALILFGNRIGLLSSLAGIIYSGIEYLMHFVFIAFV